MRIGYFAIILLTSLALGQAAPNGATPPAANSAAPEGATKGNPSEVAPDAPAHDTFTLAVVRETLA